MLAFAVLDTLLAVDTQKVWFGHLSSHGYLQHIVDSLLQDDDSLRGMLSQQPEPLRALYIFQSKIVWLFTFFSYCWMGFRMVIFTQLMLWCAWSNLATWMGC